MHKTFRDFDSQFYESQYERNNRLRRKREINQMMTKDSVQREIDNADTASCTDYMRKAMRGLGHELMASMQREAQLRKRLELAIDYMLDVGVNIERDYPEIAGVGDYASRDSDNA